MVILTLDVDEAVAISASTPTVSAGKILVEKVSVPEVKFLERMPCNWHIVATGTNTILAKSRLGDIFEGTFENFNIILLRS